MSENKPIAHQPTLGVILTNYNHGEVIHRALAAITQQERHPDQLIIVDDGSQDNSVKVIKPFLKDPRIILIQKDRNEGLTKALLTGLDVLKTDLVYFAASDDYILPSFFKHVAEAAAKYPEVAMIFGRLLVSTWQYSTEARRLALSDDVATDRTGLLTQEDFFTRYYSRFGPMSNLSPATVYRLRALEAIRYRDLLKETASDFILDSFIVQIIGGRYPSYFIDADCAVWTPSIGVAYRFFKDKDRMLKFVLTVTEYLRKEPYLSSLAPEHYGLYLFGLWYRAIQAGYQFTPIEFLYLDSKIGGAAGANTASGAPLSISSALFEAHGLVSRCLKRITFEMRQPKRFVAQVLLGFPKISLELSARAHQAIVRMLQRGLARTIFKVLLRVSGRRAGISAPKVSVIGDRQKLPVAGHGERKTISALICNFNHAKYIATAVEAVIAQTRRPDELLIMDDGSTDDSFDIIKRYADKYSWIRAFRREQNKGYISGISELTKIATGDFIHRGASDDYMQPRFIAMTMEMAERYPTVGIVSTALTSFNEQSGFTSVLDIPWWNTGYQSPHQFLHDYLEVADPRSTLAASTIFRKAVVDELGGWREELDTWDVSFVLQAAALKYGMVYIDVPAYTWCYRRGAWTHSSNINEAKAIPVCRRYFALMHSPEFRDLFRDVFPGLWLRANLLIVAESIFNEIALDTRS
ncbi:MAG: glycosyltransferase family 2 protein [Burkholderiales bacterium]